MAEQPTSQPTVAFIPNAGDTYADPYFVGESLRRLEQLGLNVKVIDLRVVASGDDFASRLDACDAVFVAGGNSFNLTYELQRSGALDVLRQAVQGGLAYFGESAGAAVLYKSVDPFAMIDDPQDVPQLTSPTALGLVDFLILPHVNREKYAQLFESFEEKQSAEHRIIRITDEQALLTRDGHSAEILESAIDPIR